MIFKTFDGNEIYYLKAGRGKNTIIFLHGAGSNGTIWYNYINDFKDNYTIYIPDLRGHGRSTKKDIKTENIILDLRCFIKELKIKNPILIGSSYGSNIIVNYNNRHKNVKKAILFNPFIEHYTHFRNFFYLLAKIISLFFRQGTEKKKYVDYRIKTGLPTVLTFLVDLRGISLGNYAKVVSEVFNSKEDIDYIDNVQIVLGKKDILLKKTKFMKYAIENNIPIHFVNGDHLCVSNREQEVRRILQKIL